MNGSQENIERTQRLREKANGLPATPGVYIMRDRGGNVIYVGKSKVIKQRVSQYFSGVRHDVKTQCMADGVYDFECMLTDTEMEALALENKLIKLYTPKYNIKLKDAKSYPYIRLGPEKLFPSLTVERNRASDGAVYFGPYSSMEAAYSIMRTAQKAFMLPSCKLVFPRDMGKKRPCINRQLGLCAAPCAGTDAEAFNALYEGVESFLRGSYREVERELTARMSEASDAEMYEAAARYRDRLTNLRRLRERQKAVSAPDTERDVIGLYSDEVSACITFFYIRSGVITDSESHMIISGQMTGEESLCAFLYEHYSRRAYVPREIICSFPTDGEDTESLAEYLSVTSGHRINIHTPQRGELKQLCDMVCENAKQYAGRYRAGIERDNRILVSLASILALEVVPQRIAAFDISNIGSDNITAGMIEVVDGKFKKSLYRLYKIRGSEGQNDYASMREAVSRRLAHTEGGLPDLILLDGGRGHVSVIRELLAEAGIDIPVFGMVKDEYHKTRTLTTDTDEIAIARDQAVFMFIYGIQEEVHRYTYNAMQGAKRKTLKHSSLENIRGIGPEKAKRLNRHFGSLTAIKEADTELLLTVKGITKTDAAAIYRHFHPVTPDGDA